MKTFASLVVFFVITASVRAQDRIELVQYLDMETVSNPQLSPDGAEIIYTRGWIDRMEDRRASSLWIMDSDGTHNRFLIHGSSPRWSPDGTRYLYLADGEPSGRQIFVQWRTIAGPATQVTRLEQAPSNVRWSPDGKMDCLYCLCTGR